MKGIIKKVNMNREMIAVEVDTNDFTVIEVLGMSIDFDLGDIITGNLDMHGRETLRNVTKGENFDAFIQEINCTPNSMRDMMK